MANKVRPIPDGYHAVTPYLIIKGAADAIEFYKKAFGATERMRMPMPDGKIGHAEIIINEYAIMLGDECPDMHWRSAETLGGSPVAIHLYVEDSDAVFKNAVDAGAKVLEPLADKFYGDRSGSVTDPFGHIWHIATHKEDISPEEMTKRAQEFAKQAAAAK